MKRQSRVGDLTPGYQAHGPDKAKQVVYFPLLMSCLEQGTSWFWMGFLPSPTRWHNLLSCGGCLTPFLSNRGDMVSYLISHLISHISSHLTANKRRKPSFALS